MYQVGDRILYPMHGAGIIKEIESVKYWAASRIIISCTFLVVT